MSLLSIGSCVWRFYYLGLLSLFLGDKDRFHCEHYPLSDGIGISLGAVPTFAKSELVFDDGFAPSPTCGD